MVAQTLYLYVWPTYMSKFFIMSTESDKNISDWSHVCTDYKNGIDFFMRLAKWPKIAVKNYQNLIFKVNFQHQKSSKSFYFFSLNNINVIAHFCLFLILCSIKIERPLFLKLLKFLAFFFDSYFWPFNKSHEKLMPFLWSWLQSEMFWSNSFVTMKNLHERSKNHTLCLGHFFP